MIVSAAQLSGTAHPTFSSGARGADEGTEANCYIVFGEMRCDRIPAHAPTHPPK